ncbi:peptidase E [Allocatelliglobosispora scoriae]|uniref:Peptidase E n=1 Tax=Allocatelliglobosispora scoriae TaxID=643052 RepID=A0A841BQ33_9ACTN|nr:peptidase E [Allocatelliglobosispora scoriae]MBB5869406.1 peptidase E [Allocatelliglobosispora scoriae]
MVADAPTILATTMGFHRGGRAWTPGPVFNFAFTLAGKPAQPSLCFLSTANGDSPASIAGFYGAFAGTRVRASHVALFDMPNVDDLTEHLLAQDVIWIDRGSLVNLIAVWHAHGLDEVLRRCWRAGVVLAGESAGSICWHAAGTTDSFGPRLTVAAGLGFLPYANAVHFSQRRKHFHQMIAAGELPSVGYATDIGAGLLYRGIGPEITVEVVSDRAGADAYRVERSEGGQTEEMVLDVAHRLD